ncbi:hypothetical protein BGZ65_012358 [Modicella reniformis]|uniref:Mitochondrial cardiolipin hydrolase n=1 Tax=Modicella reniformis TaxID=1440133 RepID=A0A9P6IMB1_9FUNG|nr:hypothetical protein BGZ65_012358 [Modicella reniformis]
MSYSTVVKETITETSTGVGTTRERLVSVYESHCKHHGSAPSLEKLFDTAREAASSDHDKDVISWLESVITSESVQKHKEKEGGGVFVTPAFFPSEENFHQLLRTLDGAQETLDICVFTITDDEIAAAVIRAHERGVRIRIITDDDKADDQGSDAKRLAKRNNIPTRVDGSPSHMHHKFAIIDDRLVVNGSYNWTKGARFENRENLTLTNSGKAVAAFKAEFEKLWEEFEQYKL